MLYKPHFQFPTQLRTLIASRTRSQTVYIQARLHNHIPPRRPRIHSYIRNPLLNRNHRRRTRIPRARKSTPACCRRSRHTHSCLRSRTSSPPPCSGASSYNTRTTRPIRTTDMVTLIIYSHCSSLGRAAAVPPQDITPQMHLPFSAGWGWGWRAMGRRWEIAGSGAEE